MTKEAGKHGDKTKSLKEGAREHKREKALNDMGPFKSQGGAIC
jgi:hypothetical protein